MDERTYTDSEVERILEAATEVPRSRPHGEDGPAGTSVEAAGGPESPRRGLTLAELREIGVEAGIDPERITRAALSLDIAPRDTVVEERLAGLPHRMTREIPLSTPFHGEEWDRVVVLLRQCFGGPGELSREGSLQTWKHGEVVALQEPDPAGPGWRLRVEVEAEEAHEWLDIAGILGLVGIIGIPVGLFTEARVLLAVIGAVILGLSLVGAAWVVSSTLPRWRQATESKLDTLDQGISALAARLDSGAPPGPAPRRMAEELPAGKIEEGAPPPHQGGAEEDRPGKALPPTS